MGIALPPRPPELEHPALHPVPKAGDHMQPIVNVLENGLVPRGRLFEDEQSSASHVLGSPRRQVRGVQRREPFAFRTKSSQHGRERTGAGTLKPALGATAVCRDACDRKRR